MNKAKTITFEQWLEKYQPVENHIMESAPYGNTMFETFGEEVEHIRAIARKQPQHVWTLLDSDVIIEGFHYVNRLGYFITQQPFEKGQTIEVYN